MSTNFLSQVKGFTPVIDALVDELDLMTAIVYGVAWRYCQMEDGVCRASLETIASRVGISRKTVERHMKALCEAGYLKDLTPEVRNKPHTYADTGLAKIVGLVEARVGQTESLTSSDSGQTESLTGRSESPTRSDTESYHGRSESPMKRESKIDSKIAAEETWNSALSELRLEMTHASFDTWLAQSKAMDLQGDTLVVTVPNQYAQDWLEKRLRGTILRTLHAVTGDELKVEFRVE